MKRFWKKKLKALVWVEANILSKAHVKVDKFAKWALRAADHIKKENLRLWVKWALRTLTFYSKIKIDEESNGDG